jgi:hypothetical protein
MRWYNLFPKETDGQSLVEFALVLPVLIFLLLVLVEVGFLIWDVHTLEGWTREIARQAGKGSDYYNDKIGEADSIAYHIAEHHGLTVDNSALRIVYVVVGEDDETAVLIETTQVNRGRTDEATFDAPDIDLLVTSHQVVVNLYAALQDEHTPPMIMVFVDVKYWRRTRTGFFGEWAVPIRADAAFRVERQRRK